MAERDKDRVLARDQFAVLYDDEKRQQIFVEGIGHFSLGGAVSKIGFYKVLSTDMNGAATFETREICLEVIVPTAALFQWLTQLFTQLGTGDRAGDWTVYLANEGLCQR